jgi:hypothetical protein
MKQRLRLRVRSAQSATTCFCDECATVTDCDAGHGITAVRDDALTHSLLLR